MGSSIPGQLIGAGGGSSFSLHEDRNRSYRDSLVQSTDAIRVPPLGLPVGSGLAGERL